MLKCQPGIKGLRAMLQMSVPYTEGHVHSCRNDYTDWFILMFYDFVLLLICFIKVLWKPFQKELICKETRQHIKYSSKAFKYWNVCRALDLVVVPNTEHENKMD